MRGRPGCRCRRAPPTGLSPVGPPWADRTLPSRRAGALLGVPLLPWVQSPVCVCEVLAAGLVSFPFPPSHPAFPALRVVGYPSGCPLPLPAGTPFHAVCAFCGLGPVALPVFPVRPLRVCALALSRRPRPSSLPGSVWRAHLASFRYRAPVGPFHAVCSPPRFLPRSRALSG